METAEEQPVKSEKELNTKRPSFFQRLRKSFTIVFHRRNVRKRNKSASEVPEKQEPRPNSDEAVNLRLSLNNDQTTENHDVPNETNDTVRPLETNFRPPAKVPLFVNDFTSELKQSLKLRSRKIEESEKSPTEAIEQIENLRALSFITNEEKSEVKIEIESKTFEEKLALFESQISGGSESVHDTLKREEIENIASEELGDKDKYISDDECKEAEKNKEKNVCTFNEESGDKDENVRVKTTEDSEPISYNIDVVNNLEEDNHRNMSKDVEIISEDITEHYVVDEAKHLEETIELRETHSLKNGKSSSTDYTSTIKDDESITEKEVVDFVKELIENSVEEASQIQSHERCSQTFTEGDKIVDVQ